MFSFFTRPLFFLQGPPGKSIIGPPGKYQTSFPQALHVPILKMSWIRVPRDKIHQIHCPPFRFVPGPAGPPGPPGLIISVGDGTQGAHVRRTENRDGNDISSIAQSSVFSPLAVGREDGVAEAERGSGTQRRKRRRQRRRLRLRTRHPSRPRQPTQAGHPPGASRHDSQCNAMNSKV